MTTINLGCFGIIVTLTGDGGGGSISSSLQEEPGDSWDIDSTTAYNAAMDGIESMILAHACAGIDIAAPAYIEGIETAVCACGNNL